MDFYGKYKSPFGYYNNANQIDSYGVNHRGFTTRDELEYQFARQQRENELMNQCKAQGITENFPQYGANFWGNSANNYGFGLFDITSNIGNMNKTTTPIPIGSAVPRIQNMQQPQTQQNSFRQVVGSVEDMVTEYYKMKNHGYKYLDDYHHCKANYNAASRGPLGYNTAKYLGDAKEVFDFYWNRLYKGKSLQEAVDDKNHDLGVNAVGRQRGSSGLYDGAQDACAEYRLKNLSFPKKYW